jgi:hypothetical protein
MGNQPESSRGAGFAGSAGKAAEDAYCIEASVRGRSLLAVRGSPSVALLGTRVAGVVSRQVSLREPLSTAFAFGVWMYSSDHTGARYSSGAGIGAMSLYLSFVASAAGTGLAVTLSREEVAAELVGQAEADGGNNAGACRLPPVEGEVVEG